MHLYFESEIPGINEKIVRLCSWKISLSTKEYLVFFLKTLMQILR